ncbi:MAG: YceI family protein [Terracidiphilus sp.]|nr:YceI family protein [Terracidiphilus sp.]
MKTMKIVPAIVFLLLAPALGFAQQTFTVNPSASSVAFGLQGTGHEVHGTFHVTGGTIQFDRNAGHISGTIIVSAASGDSGDKGRDKNMRAQVLDVEHFADVSFEAKSYQGTIAPAGDSSIQVAGIFTLHGAPHNIAVPMQIHIDGGNLTAKGSFVVPYAQWGLKDPSIFILKVAKEVHIDLNLAGSVTQGN